MQRRPAQEWIPLLARHDPVAAFNHLHRNLSAAWFLASQRHRFTDAWPGSARTRLFRIEASAGDLLRHPQTRVLTLSFLNDAQHESRGTACVSAREEVVS